uniref:Uncharacterized protein n=1 Tax=Panagrolaimus superbus TaxID=310955 RepID=A0A914YA18_9BILA
MSSSYSRDLYFSEKHKQEIIKICVNTPKLSINTLINFCRETEEEIQASRRMSSFQGSDHENFEDQRQSSHGYFPLEKRSAVFSPKQKLVHTLKPYIPRSPVGSQQRTHLTAKDIDDIRLCFIEFIFVSTLSPITCEDLGFLSAKSGLPMSFDDLVSLFGYFCFAPILREMPEFYFLDVYLDKDSKLCVPEKAVQISIAETAFLEPDMIQFKAWKTLIRDVGQIKRVWNEVVYRDIEYDYEQTQAVEFWAKIDIKRKELFGDETNEEEITDDRGNDDWDDNVITEKLSDSKIDKDEEKEIVKEKVLDNNEADSKIDDDKTFDKDAEAGDDEFEEIGTEVSEMNKDDSISSNILATDESSNSVFSSFLKDQPALKTPTVEEISVDTPTKFRKRAIPDGPESDEEEYRLENYPARNENILFNFVSTNDQKTTDAEKTKNESDDENAEIVQYSDEEIVDDCKILK